MIAVLAAALALAGAPSGASLSCARSAVLLGSAYPQLGQGTVSERACGWARSGDPVLAGRGLLVVLHEARHLAGVTNECRTERFAILHVGRLIARFVSSAGRARAQFAALAFDAGLPAEYQEGCDD